MQRTVTLEQTPLERPLGAGTMNTTPGGAARAS
jgi:hypothetical protein